MHPPLSPSCSTSVNVPGTPREEEKIAKFSAQKNAYNLVSFLADPRPLTCFIEGRASLLEGMLVNENNSYGTSSRLKHQPAPWP